MPLITGQTLHNRYRIARLLGQGGFGAVYKAWDITLNRPCAVKESLEVSPEGQRQFLREAQILANLSHPNLPRVTDFFAVPGAGQFLVMDFVEGQDLEELLAQAGGWLPEAQALAYATQACEALDYLHSQNPPVIHRDIKPANLKVTPADKFYPHGRVTLVDFGVAKVFDVGTKTTVGARAVTPGYSPYEQYGQGTTDARSDIYSLGATLYTLLTGEVPAESVQRMVRDPLISPRRLNLGISPALEAALLKALQMDPELRFQSAGEFKAAISGQVSTPSAGSGVRLPVVTQPPAPGLAGQGSAAGGAALPASPQTPATLVLPQPPVTRPFPWKRAGLAAGILAGIALLAVVAGWALRGRGASLLAETGLEGIPETTTSLAGVPMSTASVPPSPAVTRTPTATPSPSSTFTPTFTATPMPTSTPLGGGSGLIAYISHQDGNSGIYVMNADGSGQVNLANFQDNYYGLHWSPDGQQIALTLTQDGLADIYTVNLHGGGVTRLTDNETNDWFADWSPDGQQIAYTMFRGNDEIYVMNADGTGQTRLTYSEEDENSISWSPDGRSIMYSVFRDYYDSDIYSMNADGSGQINLIINNAAGQNFVWSPDGRQIAYLNYYRSGNFDIYIMNADGSGQTQLTDTEENEGNFSWSPDGRHIAFVLCRDANCDIYVVNVDGSGLTNLTQNEAFDSSPSWSPDGRMIAFWSDRDGYDDIYVMNADGSGVVRLTDNPAGDYSPVWGP